jgi:hypothetical protein
VTGADLAEWEAYERAYGPISIHERLDTLQTALSFYTAKAGGARGVDPEDFAPSWGDALERRLELAAREKQRSQP